MKKKTHFPDKRFARHRLNYVNQSAMAAGAVLLALLALRHQNLVAVGSLAATAFTVFTMPGSITASSRNVLGGHCIGLVFGSVFALLPWGTEFGRDLNWALAVGGAMFMMTVANMEHPPAAGTALSVVIDGFSVRLVLGVAVGVGVLVAVHAILRPFLRDLTAARETRQRKYVPLRAQQPSRRPPGAANVNNRR